MNTLTKSNVLDEKTKQKVIRSHIRGEDNDVIAKLKGLSEEAIEDIIKEAWDKAANTGEPIEITKNRFMSEGEILMMGECIKYQSPGVLRKKFKLAEAGVTKLLSLYAYMTGTSLDTGRIDNSKIFEKVPGKKLTNCPCCGHDKMNLISDDGEVTELSTGLRSHGLTSASVRKNAYCPSCLNEVFEIQHTEVVMIDGEKKRINVDHELNGLVKLNHWAMKEV